MWLFFCLSSTGTKLSNRLIIRTCWPSNCSFDVSLVSLVSPYSFVYLDHIYYTVYIRFRRFVSRLWLVFTLSYNHRAGEIVETKQEEGGGGGKYFESRTQEAPSKCDRACPAATLAISITFHYDDDTGWREWRMTTMIMTGRWWAMDNGTQ